MPEISLLSERNGPSNFNVEVSFWATAMCLRERVGEKRKKTTLNHQTAFLSNFFFKLSIDYGRQMMQSSFFMHKIYLIFYEEVKRTDSLFEYLFRKIFPFPTNLVIQIIPQWFLTFLFKTHECFKVMRGYRGKGDSRKAELWWNNPSWFFLKELMYKVGVQPFRVFALKCLPHLTE